MGGPADSSDSGETPEQIIVGGLRANCRGLRRPLVYDGLRQFKRQQYKGYIDQLAGRLAPGEFCVFDIVHQISLQEAANGSWRGDNGWALNEEEERVPVESIYEYPEIDGAIEPRQVHFTPFQDALHAQYRIVKDVAGLMVTHKVVSVDFVPGTLQANSHTAPQSHESRRDNHEADADAAASAAPPTGATAPNPSLVEAVKSKVVSFYAAVGKKAPASPYADAASANVFRTLLKLGPGHIAVRSAVVVLRKPREREDEGDISVSLTQLLPAPPISNGTEAQLKASKDGETQEQTQARVKEQTEQIEEQMRARDLIASACPLDPGKKENKCLPVDPQIAEMEKARHVFYKCSGDIATKEKRLGNQEELMVWLKKDLWQSLKPNNRCELDVKRNFVLAEQPTSNFFVAQPPLSTAALESLRNLTAAVGLQFKLFSVRTKLFRGVQHHGELLEAADLNTISFAPEGANENGGSGLNPSLDSSLGSSLDAPLNLHSASSDCSAGSPTSHLLCPDRQRTFTSLKHAASALFGLQWKAAEGAHNTDSVPPKNAHVVKDNKENKGLFQEGAEQWNSWKTNLRTMEVKDSGIKPTKSEEKTIQESSKLPPDIATLVCLQSGSRSAGAERIPTWEETHAPGEGLSDNDLEVLSLETDEDGIQSWVVLPQRPPDQQEHVARSKVRKSRSVMSGKLVAGESSAVSSSNTSSAPSADIVLRDDAFILFESTHQLTLEKGELEQTAKDRSLLALGLGVGLPLGIAVLGLVIYGLIRRRNRMRKKRQLNTNRVSVDAEVGEPAPSC